MNPLFITILNILIDKYSCLYIISIIYAKPSNHSKMTTPKPEHSSGKYLSFFIGCEEYGADLLAVQEICGLLPVAPVPHGPPYLKGVANLRGKAIPVLDMKTRLGMGATETGPFSCLVVLRANGSDLALLVDKVSEIRDIPDCDPRELPIFGDYEDAYLFAGAANCSGSIRLILNIGKLICVETLKKTLPSENDNKQPEKR